MRVHMLLLLDYERLVVTVHPENMPSSINKADVEQVDEVNIASHITMQRE